MKLTEGEKWAEKFDTIKKIDSHKKRIETELVKITEFLKPFENKIGRRDLIPGQLRELEVQREKLLVKQKRNDTEVDWEWLLMRSRDTREKGRLLDEELYKIGLPNSFGYILETNQKYISIGFDKHEPDDNVLRVIESIRMLSKYLLPVTGKIEGSWIVLDLHEKSCSEFGVYEFLMSSDMHEFKIIKTTHGRLNVVKTFDNLSDSMFFIRDYYWQSNDLEDNDKD